MRGEELKEWRTKARLTQVQLAEQLGVTSNTVARWERDEVSIPIHVNPAAMGKGPQVYIQRVMRENNLTVAQVAHRASKCSHRLARSTVQQMMSGRTDNPGIYTVQALAVGLGRPEEEVFAAFGVGTEKRSLDDSEIEAIRHNYNHLSPEMRRQFRPTLKMLSREIQHLLREDLGHV